MDDHGHWSLAPFYDVTFSPTAYNQHMTAFVGYGSQPPLKAIQKLAKQANFANWNQAKQVIEQVVESVQGWNKQAGLFDIKPEIQKLIDKQLHESWQGNKGLLR